MEISAERAVDGAEPLGGSVPIPLLDRAAPSLDAPAPRGRPPLRRIVAALLFIGLASAVLLYLHGLRTPSTVIGLRAGGESIGGLSPSQLDDRLNKIGEHILAQPIALDFGDQRILAHRSDLGLTIDRARLVEQALTTGKSGDPLVDLPIWRAARRGLVDLAVPLTVGDRGKALDFLIELKESVDTSPLDARLDLDRHTIAAERPGRLLQVYETLARIETVASLSDLHRPIEMAALVTPARVRKEDLADVDISTVLGAWETHYSASQIDSDRTYNLKVGADHLNGHILKPHELFSFNEVVGDRTEKEGYRVAPVISGGELIDGLAGGMCQIASTLHAASFFGGLEIVSSTPHSRPSSYIPLGLDATVVYPSTDLKLRNPFDFPIVMHFQVNQGTVKVELLGKARPYKVVFEREILEEHGFGTEGRRDSRAPRGQRLTLQQGYPGYKAIRRRYLFDAATPLPKYLGPPTAGIDVALERAKIEPVRVEKWMVHYPPTAQIIAVGSGPKALKKRPAPPSHRIPPVAKDARPIARIVR